MNFDWRYAEQFLIALVLTCLTVLTHYMGMCIVRHYFRHFWENINSRKTRRTRQQVMVGIVSIMMAAHFSEVCIWALLYFIRGMIPSLMSAMYFSIANYTTLGESRIVLPSHWQGLGGFEAMNAMLMFGWSTAMLAAVVMKIHNLED